MRETIESFRAQGGIPAFPGVVRVIDGNLVRIRAPFNQPDSYVCRKKFPALQLKVVEFNWIYHIALKLNMKSVLVQSKYFFEGGVKIKTV